MTLNILKSWYSTPISLIQPSKTLLTKTKLCLKKFASSKNFTKRRKVCQEDRIKMQLYTITQFPLVVTAKKERIIVHYSKRQDLLVKLVLDQLAEARSRTQNRQIICNEVIVQISKALSIKFRNMIMIHKKKGKGQLRNNKQSLS